MSQCTTSHHSKSTAFNRSQPFWHGLMQALHLHRQRHRLATLDDHLLRDIGLDKEQAIAESRRKIWDIPDHWRG